MKVKSIQLSALRSELLGFKQEEKVLIKGLLNEPIKFKAKYWLNKLAKEVSGEIDELQKQIVEIYKKYDGVEKGGLISVDKDHEKYEEFEKELAQVDELEIELKDYKFDLDDFDFSTDYYYPVFINLFFKDED